MKNNPYPPNFGLFAQEEKGIFEGTEVNRLLNQIDEESKELDRLISRDNK